MVLAVALTLPFQASHSFAATASTGLQVVQNGNLIRSVAHQAKTVAQGIKSYALQTNQYITALTDIKNLPAGVLNEMLAPYKETLKDLGTLSKAVDEVYTSTTEAKSVYDRRLAEIKRLNLDPEEYILNEMQLAYAKGGAYQKQIDDDNAVIRKTEAKTQALAKLGKEIGSISGTVGGLALLAKQNQALNAELIDTGLLLRQEKIDRINEKINTFKASADNQAKALEEYLRNKQEKKELMKIFQTTEGGTGLTGSSSN